jgi:hypothetical protein
MESWGQFVSIVVVFFFFFAVSIEIVFLEITENGNSQTRPKECDSPNNQNSEHQNYKNTNHNPIYKNEL